MVFCVNCGTQLTAQWNVCPQCGTKRVDKLSGSVNRLSPEDISEDGEWYWNGDKWIPVIYNNTTNIIQKNGSKSKGLAYFLNLFFFPGLGNIYLRGGNKNWIAFIILYWIMAYRASWPGEWLSVVFVFNLWACAFISYDYEMYKTKRR